MEAHDYPIEHFRMMADIAARLQSIPAQILSSNYRYESFGSWWFTFRRAGASFRLTFDGRDRFLNLEREISANDWEAIAGQEVHEDDLVAQVAELVSERTAP